MAHFLVKLEGARPDLMTLHLIKAHVAWLQKLHESGNLVLCGPCEDGTAIIVLSCDTLEEASRIAGSDPFIGAGCYADQKVRGFHLATPENNFLLRPPATAS